MTRNVSLGLGGCALLIATMAAITALVAWVFQFAWNLAIPTLFDGPTIGYLPALGAVILISIVTSGFRTVTK